MGKGKKRDKDKKEIDELVKETAPLSISDPSPSTSQAPVSQPVEEDADGLGLGSSSKSRRKKQKAQSQHPAESKEVTPMVVATTPTPTMADVPAPVPQVTQEEVESEGLGLGMSKGKSRPRKKKPAQPKSSAPDVSASAPPPAFTPVPVNIQPQASIQYPQLPGPSGGMMRAQSPQSMASGSTAPAFGPTGQFPGPSGGMMRTQTPQIVPASTASAQQGTGYWQQPPLQMAGRGAGRGAGGGAGRGMGPGIETPRWGAGDAAQQPGSARGASHPARGAPHPGSGRGTPPQVLTPATVPSTQLAPLKPVATPQLPPDRMCAFSIPLKIPSPPNRNTRTQRVLTNYLPMKLKCSKAYRYDVSINPSKPKKFMVEAYEMTKKQLFPGIFLAFDQMKNCYTLQPLPNVATTGRVVTNVEIADSNNKILKFEVSFKFTGEIDFGTIIKYMKGGTSLNPPAEAIQCIDVILKQGTLQSYTKSGRQYFLRPKYPKDLGEGLEMWTGLFQSAIFTSQAFINIDVAHKGFPRHQPMLQALTQDFKLDLHRPIDQQRGWSVDAFLDFIKGLKIVAKLVGNPEIRTREFTCNGIVDIPDRQTFKLTDFETNQVTTITVGEYYRKHKGYKINYPNLNCMWVGPRDKGIYFPMELLDVAYGQARSKQLNEKQLSTMVREAATPPDIRKKKIEEVISKMNYSANPYFRHFGLEISPNFFEVESKILDPPKLDVGQSQGVIPKNGVWQSRTVLKPEGLESWGFIGIDLDPQGSNSDMCINTLMDIGRQMGMRVAPPKMQQYNVRADALQRLFSAAVDKGINFIFVVISKRGRNTYQRVKKIAELNVGILTQCIKEVTAVARMNGQTARNILLKVNSKLMGINQALSPQSLPQCLKLNDVMVVGADVTHPSPDQRNVPSIAAVTASLDAKCFIYNIELSIQTPTEEMILQFEDMMVDHFMLYKQRQSRLPRKVFVFRDGVSEGQFAQVMAHELKAIHKAYERLSGGKLPKPEILFLLVQKRHHTRFFLPGNQARFNVSPGTVVDTHIVHPTELDFYMVSHQAIKGTARPTRYHAVCNDGKIPVEEVEQLTFYLCHLYSRCTRSVSYPTPTYYAHLACLRARSLTYDDTFVNEDLKRNPKRLRVLDRMLQHSRMFFV